MKIGITGGAGFIGGHVVDTALAHGHDVVVMDRRGRQGQEALGDGAAVELFLGDVRDATAMTELAAHVDGIIHLAACLGTQETIANPRPAAETNVMGGLNFLEAVSQYRIAGAYIGVGNHWMNNTYSISKTTVERFVHMFNKERDVHVNIVRLVNAYGPRQSVAPPFGPAKVRKILPSFICRALTGNPIEVYGDGEQVSDMVHVRDGAEALVRAVEASHAGHLARDTDIGDATPVEIGPAQSRTVNEVAEQVLQAVDKTLGLVRVPVGRGGVDPRIVHLPMRPGEIPGAKVTADIETMELLGMRESQLVPFEQGIQETVDWYAANWLPQWRERLA